MTLWVIFGALYAWAVVASLFAGYSVWRFASSHATIADDRALDAFKRVARVNMYLALIQIVVLATGTLVGILVIVKFGIVKGLPAVLVANGIVLGLGKRFKKFEDRARSLPAGTEELAQEHARVSETWLHKALPDF